MTRVGTASATSCVSLTRSFAAAALAEGRASAAASQLMLKASTGTLTGQAISLAAPAASTTSWGAKASGERAMAGAPAAAAPASSRLTVPASVARTVISRAVVLRSVSVALNWSPPRTSGGKPGSNCRSCVTRTVVLPVPKVAIPAPGGPSAIATSRKRVSESLSGTSMRASPFASSLTVAFHSSSVSNNSRVPPRPPPPPAATALRP